MSKHKDIYDIQTEILLNRISNLDKMDSLQRMNFVRKNWEDKKLQLGRAIGFGLAMVELMVYWGECDENLKDFAKRHQELFEKYWSGAKEDEEQMMQWFKELEERTGFNPCVGWLGEEDDTLPTM